LPLTASVTGDPTIDVTSCSVGQFASPKDPTPPAISVTVLTAR
jgi:hypothetical protein